ncbi:MULTISPECIES: hypothetical protein [unclassified Sphingomonas]|jgi:hypothetical protein|uniref:hypothetical protein n=1 Tax=unclassified Sphingomonas TaxID=196159 RepID=UPI000F7463F2|nr:MULTISPECIES: hypothetical protein [unclassified Sphingomonas]
MTIRSMGRPTSRVMAVLTPALLALAGCGSAANGDAPGNSAKPASVKPDGFASKVVALTEPQRQGVILRAIRDAGNDCQGVVGTRRQPDGVNGRPAWAATCQNGSNWLVSFGDDGLARVTGLPAGR